MVNVTSTRVAALVVSVALVLAVGCADEDPAAPPFPPAPTVDVVGLHQVQQAGVALFDVLRRDGIDLRDEAAVRASVRLFLERRLDGAERRAALAAFDTFELPSADVVERRVPDLAVRVRTFEDLVDGGAATETLREWIADERVALAGAALDDASRHLVGAWLEIVDGAVRAIDPAGDDLARELNWKRCALGVLGGAAAGAIAGFTGGTAGGAILGGPVGAGVGAGAGTTVGFIGGAATGAATFCF